MQRHFFVTYLHKIQHCVKKSTAIFFYTAQCNVYSSDFVEVRCGAVHFVNAFYTALHTLVISTKKRSSTLRKSVNFFVRIQVQYRKSVKNVTFSSTNHDLFLKKEYFFQIKNIFDSKKRTSLSPLCTGPEFVLFSCFCFKSVVSL
jgi:hypothetical protein